MNEIKEKLRELIALGGEESLLPKVFLKLIEAHEESDKQIKNVQDNASKNQDAQEIASKEIVERINSAMKNLADDEQKMHDDAYKLLNKKLNYCIGLGIGILIAILATIVFGYWKFL